MNKKQLNEKLFQAVGKNNIKEVKTLIPEGADVNAKNVNGRTALMIATHGNSFDITKLLIEKGANVNAKNKTSKTALTIAKKR